MANEQTIKLPRTALFFRDSEDGAQVQFANEPNGKKRFKMVVNSGADMQSFWFGKVALDLSGGKIEKKLLPALREHDRSLIAGWHDEVSFDKKVFSSGYLTDKTPAGKETTDLLADGFPFQASAGVWPVKLENVSEGATAEVNGRKFTGPGIIFRKWVLREASFCVFGADSNTSAIAAAAGDEEEINCEFIGEVPAQLTKGRVRDTERDQDMTIFGKTKESSEPVATPAKDEPKETTFSQADLDLAQRASFASGREEGLKAGREEGIKQGANDERQRILEIQKFALPGQDAIVNAAIAEGKTVDQAKGLFLEAARQEKASALDKLKGQATPSAAAVNGVEQFTDVSATDAKASETKLRSEFANDKDHDGLVKLSGGDEEEAFKKYGALRRAEESGRIRGRY